MAVAGAAPVLAVIRLRQHLATLDARAAAAAPAHGAWLRWHGPVVFLCMHEALAHLSFLLTGHRGLVRSRIGAVQAEGPPRPAGRSSCGAPSVGCSNAKKKRKKNAVIHPTIIIFSRARIDYVTAWLPPRRCQRAPTSRRYLTRRMRHRTVRWPPRHPTGGWRGCTSGCWAGTAPRPPTASSSQATPHSEGSSSPTSSTPRRTRCGTALAHALCAHAQFNFHFLSSLLSFVTHKASTNMAHNLLT